MLNDFRLQKEPMKLTKNVLTYIVILVVLAPGCQKQRNFSSRDNAVLTDSLHLFLERSKDESIELPVRLVYAKKANELALIKNYSDSLKIASTLNLSLLSYFDNNKRKFKEYSEEALQMAKEFNDSLGVAVSNRYLGSYFMEKNMNDSAYYHFYRAERMYRNIGDAASTGKVLLNMAIVQSNEKDYIGSEGSAIKALQYFLELENHRFTSSTYNTLAIVSNELKNYDEAIKYHEKSLEYKRKARMGKLAEIGTYNNLGVVYQGKNDLTMAKRYYNDALNSLPVDEIPPRSYAMLLDNLAYARFLNGEKEGLPEAFFRPLSIRDSIDDVPGKIVNNIHIAEFYISNADTALARTHATRARDLAENSNNYGEMLRPLLLLSQISGGKEGLSAAKKYIQISDSLQKEERKKRNQFARIRFETDEIEQQNREISRQKDFFIASSAVLLVFGVLIYIIKKQQARNKELKFSKAQQEKNEEIYNLMLSEQRKLDEGRQQEKQRISQELHDGVLSKLFGTRLNLDSLNHKNDTETAKKRTKYIDELKLIEQEIRQISHDLSSEIYDSNLGYTEVISNLISSQSEVGNLRYKFQNDSQISWESVSNKIKIHLYRILQEALQNINKHANANNVSVTFKRIGETLLQVHISDDGVGFDGNKTKSGIGLKNINSRVREIDGELYVDSKIGKGTNINISISV